MNSLPLSIGKYCLGLAIVWMSINVGLVACSSVKTKDRLTPEEFEKTQIENIDAKPEISLIKDRSDLDELRKDVPESVKIKNDELALIFEMMKNGEAEPTSVRSRFDREVRKRQEAQRKEVRNKRDQFSKEETRKRDDFVKKKKKERDDFQKSKHDRDETKTFYADQDEERRKYFADLSDERRNFESDLRAKSSDFESEMREIQKNFNEQYRQHTRDYTERKRLEAKKQQSPMAAPLATPAYTMPETDEIPPGPGKKLEPGE